MDWILWIQIPIVLALIITIYFYIRSNSVYKFDCWLIDMCYEYKIRRINDPTLPDHGDPYKWFLEKDSYDRKLFSIKPLRPTSWFTEGELQKINN